MFQQMIGLIEEESVDAIFKLEARGPERFRGVFSSVRQELSHPEASGLQPLAEEAGAGGLPGASEPPSVKTIRSSHPKVGRNDPCPCGAKDPATGHPVKYKKCHGK